MGWVAPIAGAAVGAGVTFGLNKLAGGGGSVKIDAGKRSPEEQKILQLQLAELEAARKAREEYEKSPQAQLDRDIELKAKQNVYARLTGTAPVLSPEEQARLDTIYNSAQSRGEGDLSRFAAQLAASRGMNVTDTPIGGEALDQQRKFTEGLTAQRAAASFDLGNAEQMFNQSLMDFQARLAQQAFMNRLALAGSANQFQSGLFGQRALTANRSYTLGLPQAAQLAGATMQMPAGFLQGLNFGPTAGQTVGAYPTGAWGAGGY